MRIYKLYKDNLNVLNSVENLNPIIIYLEARNIIVKNEEDLFNNDIMKEYSLVIEEACLSDFV